MSTLRRASAALSFAIFLAVSAICREQCLAQADPAAASPGKSSADGTDTTGGTQSKAGQSLGPIVAGPNSTVVAPASSAGASGLIVAAPGSTVVVQQVQAASPTKSNSGSKTNSLSKSKGDQAAINQLGKYANDTNLYFLRRAGAIDALGTLGAGADDATTSEIAGHLGNVLKVEFINASAHEVVPAPAPAAPVAGAAPAAPIPPDAPPMTLKYRDDGNSELLCLHVVQSAGQIGWGARSIIPQMQLLKGNNPILDSAIDRAITAMQNSPAPQTSSTPDKGSGTQNMAPSGP